MRLALDERDNSASRQSLFVDIGRLVASPWQPLEKF